jgi:hypothetical protein
MNISRVLNITISQVSLADFLKIHAIVIGTKGSNYRSFSKICERRVYDDERAGFVKTINNPSLRGMVKHLSHPFTKEIF